MDLDVHIFQALPLYVRRRVLQDGRILLSKDDDLLYALAIRTATAFEDFKPTYQRYLDMVLDDRPKRTCQLETLDGPSELREILPSSLDGLPADSNPLCARKAAEPVGQADHPGRDLSRRSC